MSSTTSLQIINLTVWESVDVLADFTYGTGHGEFLRRRREFFDAVKQPILCLWWIAEGSPHGGGGARPARSSPDSRPDDDDDTSEEHQATLRCGGTDRSCRTGGGHGDRPGRNLQNGVVVLIHDEDDVDGEHEYSDDGAYASQQCVPSAS